MKKDPYFKKVNLQDILHKKIALFVPEIDSEADTRTDPYPDSAEDVSVPLTGTDRELFLQFDRI